MALLIGSLQLQGILAPAKAADVEITTSTPSVNLDTFAGTTAHVATGVTVGPGNPALNATLQAWSLTNDGTLSGANTVTFTQGGTVTNNLSASIGSTSSAIVLGTTANGGVGTVTNAGTITGGTAGDTVLLRGGGTVTNLATGSITAANGSNTVSISGGTSRTVINSGLISNTGPNFATGILLQGAGATNTITNNATGQIIGGFNGIFTSSTASLTLNNFGSITSTRGSAVEATLGGTFVNTGTIASTNSNGILIRNNSNADVTNSGTITGAVNAISFANTGGAATAAVHTLRLQSGSVLNGNVLGGANTDNLILNGTGTESIAKFLNFETLTMNGTDWTLNNSGTFTTSSTVQAGTLRVAGQLTSPVVGVQSGATLTGNGTVIGNVTNATGGNVAVDSGTLTFNGNYVHQTGAFFTVGVTPASNGLLAITGAGHTATINGGTVRVQAGLGSYALNTNYTILTTTGGRNGSFGGVTSNFAFLDPSLTYDANNVYLTLVRNSIDFSGIGGTPNQISTGRGVQILGSGNPIVDAVLMLSPDQARAAFDSLSGEIHPSLHSLLLDESYLVRDAILGRQRQDVDQAPGGTRANALAGEDTDDTVTSSYARKTRKAKTPRWPIKAKPLVAGPVYGAWVQGYGNWTRLNGDGNAATLRASTGGAIGGLDVTLNHNWRFGLAAGGGRSEARVDARQSTGKIDTVHLAAYAGGKIGDVLFRTGTAYSRHDVSTARTIAFPGFADTATASYSASTSQVYGEAAYRIVKSWAAAEAFANLAHVRVRSDGFTETGGPAALAVAQADTSATYTTLGLRAQAPIPVAGSWAMTARGSLGWQHAFNAAAPISWMSFAASPTPFAIAGVPIGTDAFLIEAGVDALVRQNTRLSLLYSGRLAADASAHALKANLAARF